MQLLKQEMSQIIVVNMKVVIQYIFGILSFNPNLGELFRGSFWGGRGVKLPLCLKSVKIMLETSNLARKCTPIGSFRKYTF